MKIKRKNGDPAWVVIDSLFVGKIYAGMMEGIPSIAENPPNEFLETILWQGMIIGNGFFPSEFPIARYAFEPNKTPSSW